MTPNGRGGLVFLPKKQRNNYGKHRKMARMGLLSANLAARKKRVFSQCGVEPAFSAPPSCLLQSPQQVQVRQILLLWLSR